MTLIVGAFESNMFEADAHRSCSRVGSGGVDDRLGSHKTTN
jgi:hypothetical protein